MKSVFVFTAIFVLAFAAHTPAEDLNLKFEKYELDNGLDVILHEDHSIPIVAVNVWYHVGSKNEKPGRTGFAHLFEHMMFQGSEHSNEYYSFDQVGGSRNGSTNEDRTNYWENVPSNYLELALWMESDRMGYLLPALSEERLANQRNVVKNERRQNYENKPYNKAYDILPALVYPANHPYSWPTIGRMADLTAASMEDVKEFFRIYYSPSNASLSIAGDFDPAKAKELVQKYFGSIPAGPPVDRVQQWLPQFDRTRRASAEDNVELPRLYYVWHTPARFHPGDAEFDLIADVLASGKSSRLYKSLVYEKQIAQDVSALQSSQELGSNFSLEITAREGHSLEDVEKAVNDEIRRLIAQGVTANELSLAKNEHEANVVRTLQPVGGFGGRADILNMYNTYLGDPGKLQWDLGRYRSATAAGLQKYAREYLDLDKVLIFQIVPQGIKPVGKDNLDRSKKPAGAPEPAFVPPAVQRTKLSNGVEVYLVEDHRFPLVHVNVVAKGGWSGDAPQKFGLASFATEMMDEGTKTRNALQISQQVQAIGAQLQPFSTYDSSRISLNVLKKNLDAGIDLLADVALRPSFPADELERQRKIRIGEIQQEEKEPGITARNVFMQRLFSEQHPYSQSVSGTGTLAVVEKLTRQDLEKYHKTFFVPSNSAIVVAGDTNLQEIQSRLEKHFGNWKGGPAPQIKLDTPADPKGVKIVLIDRPGSAQSEIVMGRLGLSRTSPDFFTEIVANSGFGGRSTARINMNLRQQKGFSYGVYSTFQALRNPGPFYITAPVQTQSTKESVAELLKELREVGSSRAFKKEDLALSKDYLMKRFPQIFQTYDGIALQLGELYVQGLPDTEWKIYQESVQKITEEQVTAFAKKYLAPEGLLIVIVGDRAKIEPGLRELKVGDIEIM